MGITNSVTVRFELTVSIDVEIEIIGLGIEGIQVDIIIAPIDTKIQTTSTIITKAIQTISKIVTIKIEINTFLYPIAKAATN